MPWVFIEENNGIQIWEESVAIPDSAGLNIVDGFSSDLPAQLDLSDTKATYSLEMTTPSTGASTATLAAQSSNTKHVGAGGPSLSVDGTVVKPMNNADVIHGSIPLQDMYNLKWRFRLRTDGVDTLIASVCKVRIAARLANLLK